MKHKSDGKASVAASENSDSGDVLIAFAGCAEINLNGYLILLARIMFALTKIGLAPMSLCRMVV